MQEVKGDEIKRKRKENEQQWPAKKMKKEEKGKEGNNKNKMEITENGKKERGTKGNKTHQENGI